MSDTINTSYSQEPGEILEINDINLEVLPSDIAMYADNAIYEDVFIRSNGAFAFRSKHSHSKIILTLPIPLIAGSGKYSALEKSAHDNGIRLINELNSYPFCFVKSSRISSYIGTSIASEYLVFGVDELRLVMDLNVPNILFAEITLLYHDHTNYTSSFLFREDFDTESESGAAVSRPADSKLFVQYMDALQNSNKAFNYNQFISEVKTTVKNYGEESTLGLVNLLTPYFFDKDDPSLKLGDGEVYEEFSLSSANLAEHVLSTSILQTANGDDESATIRPSTKKENGSKIVAAYRGDVQLFSNINVVNAVICSRKNSFAKQFIGSHQHPCLQYIGRYPARVEIKTMFNSMNSYKMNVESVTAMFKTLLNKIDSNNMTFPEANAYNHMKVRSLPTSLLLIENIMPDQCTISASSDNKDIDVIDCTFIESSLKEFIDPKEVSVKDLIKVASGADTYKIIAEYIKVLANAKDFNTATHSTLVRSLYVIYDYLREENSASQYKVQYSKDLDSTALNNYKMKSDKEARAIATGRAQLSLVADIKDPIASANNIKNSLQSLSIYLIPKLNNRKVLATNEATNLMKVSDDFIVTDKSGAKVDASLRDIYSFNGTAESALDSFALDLGALYNVGDSVAKQMTTLGTSDTVAKNLNAQFISSFTGENYKDLSLDLLYSDVENRRKLTPFFFLVCRPHFSREEMYTAFKLLDNETINQIQDKINLQVTREYGLSAATDLGTKFLKMGEYSYKPGSETQLNGSGTTKYFASAETNDKYDALITKYADMYGLEPSLVKAVIETESHFNPNIVSPSNAKGLMQLIDTTFAAQKVGSNPFDPEQNINAGCKYLSEVIKKANGNVKNGLSFYHSGPAADLNNLGPAGRAYAPTVFENQKKYSKSLTNSTTPNRLKPDQNVANPFLGTSNGFTSNTQPIINASAYRDASEFKVDSVVDGDTFDATRQLDGKSLRVRIKLLDTPESVGIFNGTSLQAQWYGAEAKQKLRSLLPVGSIVKITGLETDTTYSERTLGVVIRADKLDVALEMIKTGHGLTTSGVNTAYTQAQAKAKADQVGMWAEPARVMPPAQFRAARKKAAEESGKKEPEPIVRGSEETKKDNSNLKNTYAPLKKSSPVTSPYGWRTIFGKQQFHYGVDFGVPIGTQVVSAASGTVSRVFSQASGGGLIVEVAHDARGFVTQYMHLSKALVSAGQRVKADEVIALSGNSGGRSTGAHLHYGVSYNKTRINPFMTVTLSTIPTDTPLIAGDYIHPDATKSAGQRGGETDGGAGLNLYLAGGSKEADVNVFYELQKSEFGELYSVYNEKLMLEKHLEQLLYNYNYTMDTAFPVIKAYITVGNENDELIEGSTIPTSQYFEVNGLQNFKMQCNDDNNPVDVAMFTLANPSFLQTTGAVGLTKQYEIDTSQPGTEYNLSFIENKIRLRPGMKFHIRAGYGNNPNNLKPIFNGMITDISSPMSMTLNIVAESFSRELLYTEMSSDQPRDLTGNDNGSTGYLLGQSMLQESITHFGKSFSALRRITKVLNPFNGTSTYDGEVRDPEAKAMLAPLSPTSYIPPMLTIFSGSGFRQRRFTNLYSADIEKVHDEFETGIINSISRSIDWTRKSSYGYFVYGTTPWQIVKEMEHRHPGTLAKPLLYEDRMTMFYGTKEQLYVARDLNPAYMAQISLKTTLQKLSALAPEASDALAKNIDYAEERPKRLEPATGFHMLSTKTNIISNGLGISNKYKTRINSIYSKSVSDFKKIDGENPAEVVQIDDNLNPWEVRDKTIAMGGCNSRYMAWLYGTQELKSECETMYGGKIVLVGDPTIKAGDYAFIYDNDRNMAGIIKVRECQHNFNMESGFTTEIVPGQYVECANFVWSLFFLKLGFMCKMTSIKLELSQVDTLTTASIAQELDYYYNYIYEKNTSMSDAAIAAIPVAAYTTLGTFLAYSAIYTNGKSNFVKAMLINGADLATSVAKKGYAKLATVQFKNGFSLGKYLAGGSSTAVKQTKILARMYQQVNGVGKITKTAIKIAGYKLYVPFKILTNPALLRVSTRLLGLAATGLRGLLVVAASNPIGALITIIGEFLLQIVTSTIEKNMLTRQPLIFFPISCMGKPYVGGMTGVVDNTYFEGLMLNIKRNLVPIEKMLQDTQIRTQGTLESDIAGYFRDFLKSD
jgi:murein DD-endopeptidase MepM/ murein hydrolase activator NlpD